MQEHDLVTTTHFRYSGRKSTQAPRQTHADDDVGALVGISVSVVAVLAGTLAYLISVGLLVRLISMLAHIQLNLAAS
jgi:hypothetical protein